MKLCMPQELLISISEWIVINGSQLTGPISTRSTMIPSRFPTRNYTRGNQRSVYTYTSSSYGVTYDYGSIMHYNAYTAAVDISKPTMIPKVLALYSYKSYLLDKPSTKSPHSWSKICHERERRSNFEENVLPTRLRRSIKTVFNETLSGCKDNNVFCGAWALKGLCTAPANAGYLKVNCQKSCNLCASGQFLAINIFASIFLFSYLLHHENFFSPFLRFCWVSK